MIKIGINGFGRIGRFVFRASLEEAVSFSVLLSKRLTRTT